MSYELYRKIESQFNQDHNPYNLNLRNTHLGLMISVFVPQNPDTYDLWTVDKILTDYEVTLLEIENTSNILLERLKVFVKMKNG